MSTAKNETDATNLKQLVLQLRDSVDELQEENERLRDEVQELRSEVKEQDERISATNTRISGTREMVGELQSRELEKSAHLHWDNLHANHVDENLTVAGDQLERITKEDGETYARLPGVDDALERGGAVAHSTADLLPIQRLARYDDEMLASTTKTQQDRLAAEAWREIDDAGRYGLWSKGCADVDIYLKSSDLADWIRQNRTGINKKYSQELARRTIEAMLDLANGRLAKTMKRHRKDGLQYQETRLEFRSDVDLPGRRSSTPTTSAGAGD